MRRWPPNIPTSAPTCPSTASSTEHSPIGRELIEENSMTVSRKLRMGMVGGGPGAFIGPVHKMAAELDGKIVLTAGAFSQSAERSRAAGESFGIDPDRAYASYQEMMNAESKREDGIDFVVIATPNHLHLPVA